MELLEPIINLLVNNGIGVGCILYFIYRDNKFNETLTTTLTKLEESINLCKDLLKRMDDKLEGK